MGWGGGMRRKNIKRKIEIFLWWLKKKKKKKKKKKELMGNGYGSSIAITKYRGKIYFPL